MWLLDRGGRWPMRRLTALTCLLALVAGGSLWLAQPHAAGQANTTLAQAAPGNPGNPAPANTPAGNAPAAGSAPAAGAATPDAAAPQGPGVDTHSGELPSFAAIFQTSPIINGAIVVLSVVALVLFLYFIATISSGSMAPPTFVDDVTKLVLNQQYREAADLCRARPGVFIASIIQRCVENADKEHSVILEMLDTEGRRRADILWNRISYLADVSNVTPMLGLYGTVYGMMRAFYGAQYQSLSASSGALTQGIAQAMSTTMFGLAVAILAIVFYSIVKSRATRALAETEHAVHTIADHLKRNAA